MQFSVFDDSYLRGLINGDEAISAHFISYFSELISLKLRSRLSLPDDIEDVRQETFARALALLRKDPTGITDASRLGPLVNTICNHVYLEHVRRKRPINGEVLEEQPSSAPIFDMASRDVKRMLAEMKPRDRALLTAVFFEERSRDDVAREYGVSLNQLSVLLTRAKNQFRQLYVSRTSHDKQVM